jgi:hypothetical protein
MFLPKINCLGDFVFLSKFFYFLDILLKCSMVDMNMSLPKINCLGEVVIWDYDFVVFHFYVQRNFVTIFCLSLLNL